MPIPITWIRDDFRMTTCLIVGAFLQSILVVILPVRIAILPAALMLGFRCLVGVAMSGGLIHNPGTDAVRYGSTTVLMPNDDGSLPTHRSDKEVVMLVLGARSSQCVYNRCK